MLPYTPEIRALIKERVIAALAALAKGVSTQEIRIFVPCPHPQIREKVKEKTKGKIPLFEGVCLRFIHTCYTTTFQMAGHPLEKTVALLTAGKKKEPSPDGRPILQALLGEELPIAEGIRVQVVTNNVHWDAAGQPTLRCSKVPADLRARLGYRRSKSDPTEAEAVFGWEVMTTVSIEPLIHREFPVGVAVGVPNTSVSERFKALQTEQVERYHSFTTLAHTGDCAFGTEPGMEQVRSNGAVPIMDYNPGREDLSPEKLLERGYDKKGWPYIACPGGTQWAIPPVRYEQETESILHACLKLCPQREQESPCPFRETEFGQYLEMSIEEHPRLIIEVPRGTEPFQLLRSLRVGSERFNSQAKGDGRLENPRLMGEHAFGVRANLSAMTVLLEKAVGFILEMTAQLPHMSTQSASACLRGPPDGEFLKRLRFGVKEEFKHALGATTHIYVTRPLLPMVHPHRRRLHHLSDHRQHHRRQAGGCLQVSCASSGDHLPHQLHLRRRVDRGLRLPSGAAGHLAGVLLQPHCCGRHLGGTGCCPPPPPGMGRLRMSASWATPLGCWSPPFRPTWWESLPIRLFWLK